MKTTPVSTQALADATRLSMVRSQRALAIASHELSSGRHADVGLALGARTGSSVELRQEMRRIETILDTNGLVRARLDTIQAGLSDVQATAEDFLGSLVAMRGNTQAPGVLTPQGALNLEGLVGTLGANLNGQFLFAGVNSQVSPMASYVGPPASPAKIAVDTAFSGFFGFAQTDPAVAGITPAQMRDFIDTELAPLFADPQWGALWSSATAEPLTSRVAPGEVIATSATAAEQPFRDLAMAYVVMSDLGATGLDQDTYTVLVDDSVARLGQGLQGLVDMRARLGVAQARIDDASDRMSIQRDILIGQIGDLEKVDPFEAATRVNALMSQVEISYSLTARIREMSLLRYL